MSAVVPITIVNKLIQRLPDNDRISVLERCEHVDIVFGTTVCEPDQAYPYVYFPISGFISLLVELPGQRPLELGLIGNEGMLGATVILGSDQANLGGIVQGSGSALRMTVPQLQLAIRTTPSLLQVLNQYIFVTMNQIAQTAACTHFHQVDARLARWLLMTQDRAHSERFHLTHEFISGMLGVHRGAVTLAAGTLQRQKLINYTRGEIHILDRKGLEDASCACYEAAIHGYRQVFTRQTMVMPSI